MASSTLFSTFNFSGYLSREVRPSFFTRQILARHLADTIEYGVKGSDLNWFWRLSAQTLQSYGEYATYSVAESGDYLKFTLPWAALVVTRAVSGLEKKRQGTPGSLDDGTLLRIEQQAISEVMDDFKFRWNYQLSQGAGTALNGGQGRAPYGVNQSVVACPSTGTYANQSRASYSDMRNQQIAATSGPSGTAAADAWWLIMRLAFLCQKARKPDRKAYKPSVIICSHEGQIEDIQNRHMTQSTNPGSNIGGTLNLFGFEMAVDTVDDDMPSNTVHMLSPEVWRIATTASSMKELFSMRVDRKLPWHVDEDDAAIVFKTAEFQLVDEFPKANGIITSWS